MCGRIITNVASIIHHSLYSCLYQISWQLFLLRLGVYFSTLGSKPGPLVNIMWEKRQCVSSKSVPQETLLISALF